MLGKALDTLKVRIETSHSCKLQCGHRLCHYISMVRFRCPPSSDKMVASISADGLPGSLIAPYVRATARRIGVYNTDQALVGLRMPVLPGVLAFLSEHNSIFLFFFSSAMFHEMFNRASTRE
jgi:hypothetical protein